MSNLYNEVIQLSAQVEELKEQLATLMAFRDFNGQTEVISHKVVFKESVVFEGGVTGDNV